MKAGDYLVCHTEMTDSSIYRQRGKAHTQKVKFVGDLSQVFTLNKKYKIIHVYDYRESQQEYFNFLFVEVETNIGQIEFINYEYKNWLCSIKKFRKKKLDNLKKIS